MSSRRLLSSLARSGTLLSDFHFISDFFSVSEQRTLLSAALLRLDAAGSRRFQKKRKTFIASSGNAVGPTPGTFLPDEYYEFSEVRILMMLSLLTLNFSEGPLRWCYPQLQVIPFNGLDRP